MLEFWIWLAITPDSFHHQKKILVAQFVVYVEKWHEFMNKYVTAMFLYKYIVWNDVLYIVTYYSECEIVYIIALRTCSSAQTIEHNVSLKWPNIIQYDSTWRDADMVAVQEPGEVRRNHTLHTHRHDNVMSGILNVYPADTIHWNDVESMLVHRVRRWPNIDSTSFRVCWVQHLRMEVGLSLIDLLIHDLYTFPNSNTPHTTVTKSWPI